MNITLYQINLSRDNHAVAFLNLSKALAFSGRTQIDSSIYDKVFQGEIEGEFKDIHSLERIYKLFNLDHPAGYKGRSMSVSDVVGVEGDSNVRHFYCDSIGFKEVAFVPTKAGVWI